MVCPVDPAEQPATMMAQMITTVSAYLDNECFMKSTSPQGIGLDFATSLIPLYGRRTGVGSDKSYSF